VCFVAPHELVFQPYGTAAAWWWGGVVGVFVVGLARAPQCLMWLLLPLKRCAGARASNHPSHSTYHSQAMACWKASSCGAREDTLNPSSFNPLRAGGQYIAHNFEQQLLPKY
jgi:hypothetical protein